MASAQNDFSKGSVVGNIMGMAIPMTAAQLINLLYNVVDRIYIGYIPEHATLSLTGLGVCLPVITAVMAFANLFGMGGAPLCSIERGAGNQKEAEAIMGNAFTLMVICGILLTILGIVFRRPLLYLFGASDSTYPYAESYMTIYLLGSVFVMMGLGMNAFINSQGFGRIGMQTVLLGAVANIILDPVFIFGFRMDVRGAALATIISQFLSAAWVLRFLVQRQEHPAAETGDHGAEKSPGAEDRFHGHVQLCRRLYQQCGGGGLQRNAPDLGRGSVCGSYDGDPFREGDRRKPGEGPYGRLPAGAGL